MTVSYTYKRIHNHFNRMVVGVVSFQSSFTRFLWRRFDQKKIFKVPFDGRRFHCKAVILLLLYHCLLVFFMFVAVFLCLEFVIVCFASKQLCNREV